MGNFVLRKKKITEINFYFLIYSKILIFKTIPQNLMVSPGFKTNKHRKDYVINISNNKTAKPNLLD